MELKYLTDKSNVLSLRRSNCTFMELKLEDGRNLKIVVLVLIVPLWNWNYWGVGRTPLK